MIEAKLKRGDVVQISPDVPNAAVRGCFLTVDEMLAVTDPEGKDAQAIKGYITSPGHSDSIRITMTVPDFDHIEYIGTSRFVHEQEWIPT